MIAKSGLRKKYEKTIDRDSAHEILTARLEQAQREEEREKGRAPSPRSSGTPRRSGGSRTSAIERQSGRVASGVFNTIVRELLRGILGTPSRRRRR
jgi:hypothetical protein